MMNLLEHSGPIELPGEGGIADISLAAIGESTALIPCAGWEYASFHAEQTGEGTYGTAVLTVQEAIDAAKPRSTTITIPAGGGMSTAILTVRAPYVRVSVTTAEGGAGRARVWAFFWNSRLRRNGV